MTLVVYDIEILRGIPEKGAAPDPQYPTCQGWHDRAGMGISVIGAYVLNHGYRVFLKDNFSEFLSLVSHPDTVVAGFNNHHFDDLVVTATLGAGIEQHRSYDLLGAYTALTGRRVSLHALSVANFLPGKSGSGAEAPKAWARGEYGRVIDYCLTDVRLTWKLMQLAQEGALRDPTTGKKLEGLDARLLHAATMAPKPASTFPLRPSPIAAP